MVDWRAVDKEEELSDSLQNISFQGQFKHFYIFTAIFNLAPSSFVNLSFCLLVILSTCHFVYLSFCLLVILPTCHFANFSFCQIANPLICQFVKLQFHKILTK